MKKIILYLFLASTTIFVSCDKDDNNDAGQAQIDVSLIAGAWNMTSFTLDNGKITTNVNGQDITGTFFQVGKDFDYALNFSDSGDPKTFTSSGGYTSVITSTFFGQTNTQEEMISDYLGSGEWRVEGNNIIFIENGEEQISEITSLTSSSMSLRSELNETITQQGSTSMTTGTVNITLEKN